MCLAKWMCWGSAAAQGGDVEVVNEAEFYTLHPLAMQSDFFAMRAGGGGRGGGELP
jgi:hypothetical protein